MWIEYSSDTFGVTWTKYLISNNRNVMKLNS